VAVLPAHRPGVHRVAMVWVLSCLLYFLWFFVDFFSSSLCILPYMCNDCRLYFANPI
jgi:hypothetical protein